MSAVSCHLSTVVVDELNDSHSLLICENDGDRSLRIYIGASEALAAQRHLTGQQFPRPLTHDLTMQIIESLDAQCAAVHIARSDGETYFAELHLRKQDGSTVAIDARPSDAIALLTRSGDIPLSVAEDLLTNG